MSKNAYLKAMQIDVWVERTQEDSGVQKIEETKKETLTHSTLDITPVLEVKPAATVEPIQISVDKVEDIDVETLDWQALLKQVSACERCVLSQTRTRTIFGAGNQTASLMIIADDNNEQSSKLLTSMLKAMGYQRSDVYISDIVKCNVTENNEASAQQVESCEPYLLRQISLVQPKLILALGNAAAQRLLKSKSTMNRLRGQLHYVDGISAPILVSYHPTYLLAAPNEKRKAWEDLQIAMKELTK